MDLDLYSRSIKAYGYETMVELSKLSILVIGMRGLGVEVVKNLALTGPKIIEIFDQNICTLNDMGSNFYIKKEHVEKKERRDQASISALSELNRYVTISIMNGNDILKNLKLYNVIIITEIMETSLLINIDEKCRQNNIAFIYGCSLGLSCFIFSDFGENFVINDINGEERKTFVIENITNDKKALVTIDQNNGWNSKFNINEEDNMIIFSGIKGMEELNDNKPRKFIKKDIKSFYIEEDTSSYGKYLNGGYAKQYKPPKIMNYKTFKEKLEIPFDNENFPQCIDFRKPDNIPILHISFLILHEYYDEYKKLPNLNDIKLCEELSIKCQNLYEQYKEKNLEFLEEVSNFNKDICINVFRWAKSEISPVCSFLGGIIAQEAIKKTGKFTPIDQWFWFDFFEIVSKIPENVNRKTIDSRYDDQIAIFGQEIQDKLGDLNIFLIGAGANGSEFLKHFAMMGISDKKGKTIVTDDDIIEVSNLNRQFLFRYKDIGQSKSKIACEEAKKFNSNFKIESKEIKVCQETEDIFNDEFWKNQNLIIFAVDSNIARKYIDNQCTQHKLIGIDAGTLGTKGRVQLIIPDKSICFNDNPDPEEETIPMCTLHHYPNTIRHCIEWAKIKFIELFIEIFNDIKNLIKNPNEFFENIVKESKKLLYQKINLINEYIDIINQKNLISLIQFAMKLYNFYFINEINKIIKEFPKDFKNKDGTLYWAGSKRFPHPILFDKNNELCQIFMKKIVLFLSNIFNIEIDESNINNHLSVVEVQSFKFNEKEKEKEEVLKNLYNEILKKTNLLQKEFEGIKWPKFDKENNTQIFIIHSFANLRALNFDISQCSFINTKLICGKIVPSIPTSTAAVGGLVSLQIFSLIQNLDLINLSNCFFNLAVSLVIFTEPKKVIHNEDKEKHDILGVPVKYIPKGWTVWDHIEIRNIDILQDFINYIKNIYEVDVSTITSDKVIIYQSFSKKKKLDEKIENIFHSLNKNDNAIKKSYLWLDVVGKQNQILTLMPKFKYFLN